MTPIFEGQTPQDKAFSNQNKGSRYIYIYLVLGSPLWEFGLVSSSVKVSSNPHAV